MRPCDSFKRAVLAAGVCLLAALDVPRADARACRVILIPNGLEPETSCLACHSAFGGDVRNRFGRAVERRLAGDTGCATQIWDATLARLDSDRDGYPNGVELQDPHGAWVPGMADPGDRTSVSNPGDARSTPPNMTPFPTPTPWAVDLNDDDRVDAEDLLLWMRAWQRRE